MCPNPIWQQWRVSCRAVPRVACACTPEHTNAMHQLAAGGIGICVKNISEAQASAMKGFDDILSRLQAVIWLRCWLIWIVCAVSVRRTGPNVLYPLSEGLCDADINKCHDGQRNDELDHTRDNTQEGLYEKAVILNNTLAIRVSIYGGPVDLVAEPQQPRNAGHS